MNSIPVDQLQNKTNAGLQIKVFGPDDKHEGITDTAHRDDHYIFFLLKSGFGTLKVDSEDVKVTSKELYYILPSQVHYHIKAERAEGWFLAVDTSLIKPELRAVFERRLNLQHSGKLSDNEFKQYSDLLGLLHIAFLERQNDQYYFPIIHTLAQAFLAMAASSYHSLKAVSHTHTRAAELTFQFKDLVTAYYHTIKSPSEYASKLNVSPGYLNESVKRVTGSTVSYWIGQEIFSEAKRLLNHTDAGVKQIAYELGYLDYAYFIRSFRKMSGLSPSDFRKLSRN